MTCKVDGCGGKVVSRGLCDKHRIRLAKHGSVDTVNRPADWGKRTRHPLYKLWHGMILRCHSQKHKSYADYGARGVTVCERWRDFWAFLDDMGPRPSAAHSVERKDCNGNYCPENCVWGTYDEQARNRRNAVITREIAVEIKRRMALGDKTADIGRSLGLPYDNVRNVVVGLSWGNLDLPDSAS